jgi:hypothetical protein
MVAALALGGCSRQPPLQPAPPCVDLTGAPCAVGPAVSEPAPTLAGRDAGVHRHKSARRTRHKRIRHHVEARHDVTPREPVPAPPAPWIPPAKSSSAAPSEAGANTAPAAQTKSGGASVQEQVAVATALAERITALSALPAPNARDQADAAAHSDAAATPAQNRLVAVVMVRPGVHTVSELRGRVIAIDERYAAAHNKVTAGMAAAGASEVQLMQGQGTAINRLTNGEVSAAVVALVVPDAAEAFPEIAGYRIFRVPLPTL